MRGDRRCEVTATSLLTPMAAKEKRAGSSRPVGSQDRAVNGSEPLGTGGGWQAAEPPPTAHQPYGDAARGTTSRKQSLKS